MTAVAATQSPASAVRRAGPGDLEALLAIENAVFSTDRLSPRSLRRFLTAPQAEMLVAEHEGRPAGYALVLFRPNSGLARLYSIAISPEVGRRGIGRLLLRAAEEAAARRHARALRLEVHEQNDRAIALYRQAGYRQFGRHPDYYGDHGAALRFEKRLDPALPDGRPVPPYFHQTTEFTCGPACIQMALAWADPAFRADPGLEITLWREATTIFMSGGPGGCGPYGLALALRRRGFDPEIFVNRPGPYFLDSVRDEDQKRVIRLAQAEFEREAGELHIPTHASAIGESALIEAFDHDAVAIVLVTGYYGSRAKTPHWIFAFGHGGRCIFVHDPAAPRDQTGARLATKTHAVPWAEFHRWSVGAPDLQASGLHDTGLQASSPQASGPEASGLQAAIVIRKGRVP